MLTRTLAKRRTARPRPCNPLLPFQRLARALYAFAPPLPLPLHLLGGAGAARACVLGAPRRREEPATAAPAGRVRSMSRVPLAPAAPLPRVGSGTPTHAPPPISLTAKEAAIFDLLRQVRRDEGLEDLTLRVAGGWVRDKLLGREMREVDIDIALDTMYGREFAEVVNRWMEAKEMEIHGVGVIERNPDQSKHLETATMKVLDVWLDLVNLRTETYSHDSRIPDVQIGTPHEDAMRRDLTINALFYNINSGAVEDLTGRGLDDLRARIVRTPLPPLTTLLDDPLRALRAIRFASRLNFSFDADLFEACKSAEVRRALDDKVSRERVATELDGIMKSARPTHALGLLVELELYAVVFRVPDDLVLLGGASLPADLPQRSLSALLNLEALWNAADDGTPRSPEVRQLVAAPIDTRIAAYAATLAPLAGKHCEVGRKRKRTPLVHYVCMEQLRMSSKDVKDIERAHEAAGMFRRLAEEGKAPEDRLSIGLTMKAAGPQWRTALQVALVTDMSVALADGSCMRGVDKRHRKVKDEDAAVLDKYGRLMMAVQRFNLEGVWDLKPIINGNGVMKALPKVKGKSMGHVMQKQVEWMIQNPNKGQAECHQWLQDTFPQHL